jgi:hypothetical protein
VAVAAAEEVSPAIIMGASHTAKMKEEFMFKPSAIRALSNSFALLFVNVRTYKGEMHYLGGPSASGAPI